MSSLNGIDQGVEEELAFKDFPIFSSVCLSERNRFSYFGRESSRQHSGKV